MQGNHFTGSEPQITRNPHTSRFKARIFRKKIKKINYLTITYGAARSAVRH